jgi:hypothetical protein
VTKQLEGVGEPRKCNTLIYILVKYIVGCNMDKEKR